MANSGDPDQTSLIIGSALLVMLICPKTEYRPLSLCRLRVSRYYHLYPSDFSFPTFFLYISLHFNSVYVENG